MIRRSCVSFALAALVAVGCGGKPVDDGPDPTARNSQQLLGGLSEIYSLAQTVLKRPPAKMQEVEKYSRAEAFVYPALVRGDVIVLWGANIGAGNAVLAYEKDAPTQGGWVLLQDRSMKKLTADEFKSTPKAGPGT